MAQVALDGAQIEHNSIVKGTATATATRTNVNGTAVLRHDDPVTCAEHGQKKVVSSSSVLVEGKPIARVGDETTCGATIKNGSGNVNAG